MSNKIHWRVADAPTGRYRSFQKRGWPMGWSDKNQTRAIATILCEDSYAPEKARSGEHAELSVRLAIRKEEEKNWQWRRLVTRFTTLDAAKAAAQAYYDANPHRFT
jgi:hypothetical protein